MTLWRPSDSPWFIECLYLDPDGNQASYYTIAQNEEECEEAVPAIANSGFWIDHNTFIPLHRLLLVRYMIRDKALEHVSFHKQFRL